MKPRNTHCAHGHKYTEANTYWKKNGTRECQTCRDLRSQERYLHRRLSKPIALRRIPQPSNDDRHWAAGLFEGEGTITMTGLGKRKPHLTYSRVTVGNTDFQVVDFFYIRWGGSLRKRKKIPGKKQAYEWTCAGSQTWIFLNDILPFIRTARVRQKAHLLVEAEEFRKRSPRFGRNSGLTQAKLREYRDSFRLLNQRGDSTDAI